MISLSLGLEEDYIEKALGEQEQHMAVNYYPQCPEPELTYGLPKHTDPNALTVLLQDPNVAGLQVLKDGSRWIAVNPRPNAFVINLGDQLQVNKHKTHLVTHQFFESMRCVLISNSRCCGCRRL
jgi:isopenicillin N synthase-like dioxygenase